MDQDRNIALLFFSRKAEKESKEKQFGKLRGEFSKLSIAKSLISVSSNILSQSGLPVYHFHEGNQSGNTFGERIANAYSELFDLGYQSVIAVGNDSPGIALTNWSTVCEFLKEGESVLGPSRRGGSYLIGLNAQNFDKTTFQNLPWQTGKLYKALQAFCKKSSERVAVLKTLHDINSVNDLNKVVSEKESTSQYILFFAELLFGAVYLPPISTELIIPAPFLRIRNLRAPPLAA